ncbi:hypothetical protein MKW94_018949, partial [Papaver nudicaule]|nr:hypothetical protein [Papaver nudicaule]
HHLLAALENNSLHFPNLRVVKLESYFLSRHIIQALGWLLHLSPNVESLSIVNRGMLEPSKPENEDYWAGVSWSCKLHCLRSVEIRGLLGYYNELKLVEIIFKNAVVLEKMVLYSSKESTADKRLTFGEKLLKLPRASFKCHNIFGLIT